MSGEVWFYHLERSNLEEILPDLLGKILQRGWRALVCAPGRARLEALDERLWTFAEDSFLPHGLEDEPWAARQPILLSTSADNLNSAQVQVLLDGARGNRAEDFERTVLLFDGVDEGALATARERWAGLKAAGLELAYWRQKQAGGWERQG